MRKILLSISLCLTSILLFANKLDSSFQLIPQPQFIQLLEKQEGIMGSELTYIFAGHNAAIPVLGPIANSLPQHKGKGKGIVLKLTSDNVPASHEGYVLEVTRKGVVIMARDKAGLFYGCQTLEQLLEDNRDFNKPIPAMKITDYPSLDYRAVHFDNKHHLDRMEYYYREIDKLAKYKINAVIWEIEDKLRYTRRPEIAAPNAISKQEMAALCRYAQERNVEISPLVQGLGHAGFILKHHWELRENPDSDWEFCPSDPRTYEVQFDLYRDAIEAMPYGRYLHVGGDEITAIGIDERCKATGKTPFELQMYWLKKVCDFAIENGRIPIFWDDMPLKYAGVWNYISGNEPKDANKTLNTEKLDAAIELFPKECVYMRWNYNDATIPEHKELLEWYHNKGLKVMAATGASIGSSTFMPRNNSRSEYIKGFSQLVADNNLEGILATAWDDGSPHLETVWRGYIAQGEFGWNPSARNIHQFKEAHAQREFGFKPEQNRMQFLDELEETLFFFDGALVTAGRRNPAWQVRDFKLIELPNKEKPGEWSNTYKKKIERAYQEEERYQKIAEGINTAKQHALRNRYTLQIYEQTNHLQNYPTKLIIALHEFDIAVDNTSREKALARVSEVCSYFKSMRANLEEVYSKTRFMQNPEGYIADLNHHHHLSAKTNNSDWIFLYELPMVRKTLQWIEK